MNFMDIINEATRFNNGINISNDIIETWEHGETVPPTLRTASVVYDGFERRLVGVLSTEEQNEYNESIKMFRPRKTIDLIGRAFSEGRLPEDNTKMNSNWVMNFINHKFYNNSMNEDGDGGGGDGGADDPSGNTSDSHPGYNTPNAFGNRSSCGCKGKSCSCGTKLKTEASYKDYKLDQSYSTDKDKVNKSIKLLYSALCEIERKLKHTSKFKTETGMDDAKLLKSTKNTLEKLKNKTSNILELIDSIYNQTDKGDL